MHVLCHIRLYPNNKLTCKFSNDYVDRPGSSADTNDVKSARNGREILALIQELF